VTGGGRGIGRATSVRLGEAGARVAVGYLRDAASAQATVAAVEHAGGEAIAVAGDCGTPDGAQAVVAAAADALGTLGGVVANAGTWRPTPMDAFDPSEWDAVVRENLSSKAFTVQAALQRCADDLRVVLVSSTAGQRGEARYAAYAAAQAGTIALGRSLAAELGPRGIRVNTAAPGWVVTDMSRDAIAADRDAITAAIPLRRIAEPDDLAGPIAFLLSDLSRHVHGSVLSVNGGAVLHG
jgi:3-oxoacyl-[acyl-carrier protein] reductase